MSGIEPPDPIQWREAKRWLAKANEDLSAAQLLLSGNLLDPAAFHVQQALEKALKALAVAAGHDVRRTHDLETLMAAACQLWPALVSFPSPLADISEWYLVSRYPDIDERSPEAAEIHEALDQVISLIGAIEAQGLQDDAEGGPG